MEEDLEEQMEEPSISLFCDDSYLCLLATSSSDREEESTFNETLMPDDEFAQELQLQEAIMASLITATTIPFSSSLETDKTKTGESSKSFCELCVERTEKDEMFSIQDCNHSCCITCITRYVSASIPKNITGLTCPVAIDCKGTVEIEGCRGVVPQHLISRWDGAICESLIDSSQKFYCPYKDCSSLMVIDGVDQGLIREAECLFCRRLLCVQCRVPWHSGVGCEEFKGMNENERGRGDLMVHELAKEKKWQRCPSCRFFVEKNEGCLHMTCRCGRQFCYACGGIWSPTHGCCR